MKRIFKCLALYSMSLILVPLTAQIPNSGFEEWVQDGDDYNPAGWNTSNNAPILTVSPFFPPYAGNLSMKVNTFNAGIMVVPGVAAAEFPYMQRPSAISACLKTNVMPGDRVLFIISMFSKDSIIALPTDCSFSIDSTIADFTCFTFPITYRSDLTPDSASIIIMAGSNLPQAGTEIIVDELSFHETTVTVPATPAASTFSGVYPNPAGGFAQIGLDLTNESDVVVFIWDSRGSLVRSLPFDSLKPGKHELKIETGHLAKGIYPFSVRGKDVAFHGRLIIQ